MKVKKKKTKIAKVDGVMAVKTIGLRWFRGREGKMEQNSIFQQKNRKIYTKTTYKTKI